MGSYDQVHPRRLDGAAIGRARSRASASAGSANEGVALPAAPHRGCSRSRRRDFVDGQLVSYRGPVRDGRTDAVGQCSQAARRAAGRPAGRLHPRRGRPGGVMVHAMAAYAARRPLAHRPTPSLALSRRPRQSGRTAAHLATPVATELEITELADREMKSPGGGKALLFEQPTIDGKPSRFPLAINTMGSRAAHGAGARASRRWTISRTRCSSSSRPSRRPTCGRAGTCSSRASICSTRGRSTSRTARARRSSRASTATAAAGGAFAGRSADPQVLAAGRRPVRHAAQRLHARPRHGRAQPRHVPDAGLRRPHHRHALAGAQGRRAARQALLRTRRADAGGGLPGRRPGVHLCRHRAAAGRPGRDPVCRVRAQEIGRTGAVRDDRPRSARRRGFRARRLRPARRDAAGRAVRRPHRLLHAGGRLPGVPPHGDHPPQGRRFIPRPSSACRRWRISTWATPACGCSCRCSR